VFCSGFEPKTTGHVTPAEAIWVWQLWMSDRKTKLKIKQTEKQVLLLHAVLHSRGRHIVAPLS